MPPVRPGQVSISFGGHATVLVRYAEQAILCDPMLGRWVKGARRAVAPGLTAEDLQDVRLVLISHTHADHLHRPTLDTLPKAATVVVPPQTAQRVSDLGFARVIELRAGQGIQDHGIDIATAAVRHGDKGNPHCLSYVIRGSGPSVYFCGDSGYCRSFAEIGARHQPDIAILPIGGYLPLSFRERHMSPLDALYALEDLGARIMIPIHHGAFALSYERLYEPSRWLSELVRERGLENFVIELAPGESRVFVPPQTERAQTPSPVSFGSSSASGAKRVNGERKATPGPIGQAANLALQPQALPAVPASAHMRLTMPPRPAAVKSKHVAAAIEAALDRLEDRLEDHLELSDAVPRELSSDMFSEVSGELPARVPLAVEPESTEPMPAPLAAVNC